MNGGPGLDPELLALLRREDEPPAGVRDRVRGKVLAAALLPLPVAALPGAWNPLGRVSPLAWKLVAVAFVVGAGAGALLHASLAPPKTRVVYVDRPLLPAAIAEPAPRVPALLPAPITELAPSSELAGATHADGQHLATPAPSRSSRLAAERKLLDGARDALVAGNVDAALARLDRHRREFSRGLLAEERDAMTIQALAAAGRGAEARRAAATFRAKSPASLFLPIIETALSTLP